MEKENFYLIFFRAPCSRWVDSKLSSHSFIFFTKRTHLLSFLHPSVYTKQTEGREKTGMFRIRIPIYDGLIYEAVPKYSFYASAALRLLQKIFTYMWEESIRFGIQMMMIFNFGADQRNLREAKYHFKLLSRFKCNFHQSTHIRLLFRRFP